MEGNDTLFSSLKLCIKLKKSFMYITYFIFPFVLQLIL